MAYTYRIYSYSLFLIKFLIWSVLFFCGLIFSNSEIDINFSFFPSIDFCNQLFDFNIQIFGFQMRRFPL